MAKHQVHKVLLLPKKTFKQFRNTINILIIYPIINNAHFLMSVQKYLQVSVLMLRNVRYCRKSLTRRRMSLGTLECSALQQVTSRASAQVFLQYRAQRTKTLLTVTTDVLQWRKRESALNQKDKMQGYNCKVIAILTLVCYSMLHLK